MAHGNVFVGECPICNGDEIVLVVVGSKVHGWCPECDAEFVPSCGDDSRRISAIASNLGIMRLGNWHFASIDEARNSDWHAVLKSMGRL